MGENGNILFGALIGTVLLNLLLLTVSGGWSWWYPPLTVVLLIAAFSLRTQLIRRTEQAALAQPAQPPSSYEAPERPRQTTVAQVELLTNTPEYRLLFSATTMWEITAESRQSSHADPEALANQAVIERAAAVVHEAFPADVEITKARLGASLGEWQTDSTGQVRACAVEVRLAIRDQDADRIDALLDIRKKVQTWEREREHERGVREYLAEDALKTNGSALVWWIAGHINDISGAVARIGDLARLSAVSQGRDDIGAVAPYLVSTQAAMRSPEDRDINLTCDLLSELFPDSAPQRVLFARHLAQMAEEAGQDRYSRRLREMFGLQDMQDLPLEPDDEEPTSA